MATGHSCLQLREGAALRAWRDSWAAWPFVSGAWCLLLQKPAVDGQQLRAALCI